MAEPYTGFHKTGFVSLKKAGTIWIIISNKQKQNKKQSQNNLSV